MNKTLVLLLIAGTFFWAGCGSSNDFNQISGQQGNIVVPNAPVAQNRSYNTNSNTPLVVTAANGVLAGINQTGVTAGFPTTTSQNGTVAGNQDGGFTYTPPANFSGVDTFSFTAQNDSGQSQATVTITVVAVNGFFVDAVNGSDTTGSFTNGLPFQTIQAAVTAAGTGETIVVRPGNYTGTVNLLNNQSLVGAGSTLVNPQSVALPVLTGPVILADGNTVDSLRIANAPSNAIDCSGQNGGTITNCQIDSVAGGDSAVFGLTVRGNWTVSNNIISNAGGGGVIFTTSGTDSAVIRVNNNTVTNNGTNAIGFITSNSSDLRAQVTGNQMTGNQTGFTFEVIAGGASTSCYDIEGNTNDDTYRISQNSTATGTLEVEELNNLIAVNNNSGTLTQSGGSIAPTHVEDGHCGF